MNNQKDTDNTNLKSQGHKDLLSYNAIINKSPIAFPTKKTEKLVTALYMVTDYMDADEVLKTKLRSLGVSLLSDIHKLQTLSYLDQRSTISRLLSQVSELLSFVSIASTMGFISEMNSSILNREFENLFSLLEAHKANDKHFTFTLDGKMFEVEDKAEENLASKNSSSESNFPNGHFAKKINQNLSTRELHLPAQNHKGLQVKVTSPLEKEARTQKIISLIKDTDISKAGISIKDISSAFKDCGEKTIQRELNALVAKGLIKKIGSKRWSRYQYI